jgi:hypothetical protein
MTECIKISCELDHLRKCNIKMGLKEIGFCIITCTSHICRITRKYCNANILVSKLFYTLTLPEFYKGWKMKEVNTGYICSLIRKINTYKIFCGKSKWKQQPERPAGRWMTLFRTMSTGTVHCLRYRGLQGVPFKIRPNNNHVLWYNN